MTSCVGLELNAGPVFLSDRRTGADPDAIGSFRTMRRHERPGDRFMATGESDEPMRGISHADERII